MNIEISTLKNHFFKYKTKENTKTNEKNKSKIVNYCFYSINEIIINNKIKKIPYYSNFFSVIKKCDFVNINSINEKVFEKIKMENNNKYLLLTYNIKNNNFNNFLFQFENPQTLVLHTVLTFSYILNSLILLQEKKICFFQLSFENIVFEKNFREKPLLTNFEYSIDNSKLNEDYITKIIKKTKDYSLKPLEIHILFYLIENDMVTVSYSFIEEVTEIFIQNLNVHIFPKEYIDNYQTLCISYLKKYINKSKKYIINDILNYSNKWDVYSIGMLFLNIFSDVCSVFSLKNTFLNKIAIELLKTVHPDPSKRLGMKECNEIHQELLNKEKDWNFVYTMETKRMVNLWKN
jgi:hypothetical protein